MTVWGRTHIDDYVKTVKKIIEETGQLPAELKEIAQKQLQIMALSNKNYFWEKIAEEVPEYIKLYYEDGIKGKTSVYLPKELYKAIKEVAFAEDRTVSDIITECLLEKLKEFRQKRWMRK